MSDETTELSEKLNKLIIELDRLDNTLDSPSSGMTIGEYEQEREKLLDGFTQAIAAWNARAERTCECVSEYAKSPFDGKTIVLHRCSACHELMRPHMHYCPNCGCKVVDA